MLLVVDVGNTNTVLGLFEGSTLRHTWRISTTQRTTDEFGLLMLQLLAHQGVTPPRVQGVAIGTVVPSVLYSMEKASRRYLQADVRVVDPRKMNLLPMKVDNQIGRAHV